MSNFNLKNGDNIYKYQLIRRIGGGHFGEVWLANDNALARQFAIKLLDASQTSIGKELNEARIGHRMRHDNLIQVHIADVVKINGNDAVIIAMDYLKNGSIDKKICAGNFAPVQISVMAITNILVGLEHLHDNGFYHNDIKPQNILIGDNHEAILTDYGISVLAPIAQPAQVTTSYGLHTAPEIFTSQKIDSRTDIYQIGLTLFRLVNGVELIRDKLNTVGRPAFDQLIVTGKLIRPDDYQPFVPPSLKRVINKAINSDPAKRYQSALEMRRALEKLRFPGFWICDDKGNNIGEDDNHTYSFEIIHKAKNLSNFTACKTAKRTNRTTKIGKYTTKNRTDKQLQKLQREFMTAVVEGKI